MVEVEGALAGLVFICEDSAPSLSLPEVGTPVNQLVPRLLQIMRADQASFRASGLRCVNWILNSVAEGKQDMPQVCVCVAVSVSLWLWLWFCLFVCTPSCVCVRV